MTRGCRCATTFVLFAVLLLPLLSHLGTGAAVAPHAAAVQETTPETDARCDQAVEPNDDPVDAQDLPAITACVAAEHDDAGQDIYRWTVSEEEAGRRWTVAASGIPNQAISVNVFHGDLDDAGAVVDQTPLASADGGAGEGPA